MIDRIDAMSESDVERYFAALEPVEEREPSFARVPSLSNPKLGQ